MAVTKYGRLAAVRVKQLTLTQVYAVTALMDALVTIRVVNTNLTVANNVSITVVVVGSVNLSDAITFRESIDPKQRIVIPDVKMSVGEGIYFYTTQAGVVVRIDGEEFDTV